MPAARAGSAGGRAYPIVRTLASLPAALLAVPIACTPVSVAAAYAAGGCDRASGAAFESVETPDGERPVIVATSGDDPALPHDLVVAFHGRTNTNAQVRRYFDLEAHARRPTVFVYPSALPVDEAPRAWADAGDPASSLRDYALLDAVVDAVEEHFCLDRERVFAVGHSLGASFANSLACARGASLRGVATIAGGISAAGCTGEVAALLLHHPEDRLVPVDEGHRALAVLLGQNGLDGTRPATAAVAGFDCRRWSAGSDTVVLWCLHDDARTRSGRYYPHGWPDAAGEAIMDFFASLD